MYFIKRKSTCLNAIDLVLDESGVRVGQAGKTGRTSQNGPSLHQASGATQVSARASFPRRRLVSARPRPPHHVDGRRSSSPIASSVRLSSNALASELTCPPSNAATTRRRKTSIDRRRVTAVGCRSAVCSPILREASVISNRMNQDAVIGFDVDHREGEVGYEPLPATSSSGLTVQRPLLLRGNARRAPFVVFRSTQSQRATQIGLPW